MSEAKCLKHNITPADERWKVMLEELTACEDEMQREAFKGEVCPACYIHLKERLQEVKRNLKVESREAVHLRAQNDYLQSLLDIVVQAIKEFSGKDARELAEKEYPRFPTAAFNPFFKEKGDLRNILPNLIAELANKGAKK